ncbi:MAG TPA: 50S ribosomal protein L11 methyltransferase, partial [Gaiellaceae bacterium]
ELFPDGFEEVDHEGGLELAAYTDAGGEERVWHTFGAATAADVEAGWEERWRAFHRPVEVGRIWVGPPWEEPPADATAVVIDPGRAFGTGAHPTTQLCLEALIDLERGSLLDVGCGSGVLSIGAALLGYAPVTGIDTDPAAIEATRENAEANGVTVEARRDDGTAAELPEADVTVANISLEGVNALHPRSTVLVTSGYLVSERPEPRGYTHAVRRQLEGWAADVFRRGSE